MAIAHAIGRVLLNISKSPFYAFSQKKKVDTDFNPAVSVTTKLVNGDVRIKVKDNGNGIPQRIADKVFQPFFTTKPTGEGTGLGLSLSYDIIKAHGGEIIVKSNTGDGAEFILKLPA
jgi:signal transduction histidine kinase